MLEVVQKGLVKIAKKYETPQFIIKILNDDIKSSSPNYKNYQKRNNSNKNQLAFGFS